MMCSSPSPTPSLSDQLVPVSTSVQSLREMAASLAQDTMVPQQVLPTAPIRPTRYVSVQCTLKPTSSLTLQDMEQLSRGLHYMLQTHPAIRAHVSSLMRAYRPWFSIVSIEIKVVLECWQT